MPLTPAPAFAEPALVDQVERLDVERSEVELEWQSIFAAAANDEPRTAIHIFSGEYGLNDRVSLGFELGAEDENGGALEAEYLFLQAKFMALDPREHGIGFGAQASLGPALNGGEGEAELEILGEVRFDAFSLASDVSLEAPLDDFSEGSAQYALRADWSSDFGVVGIEAGGDLQPGSDEARRHWIGPVIAVRAHEDFLIELSYLAGLTQETPEAQIRLQLTLSQ
jgi:hypothetical protein